MTLPASHAARPVATLARDFGARREAMRLAAASISEMPILQVPNATDPRSLSPGTPLAVYGGVRVRL